ncbi:MAG: patatin-like phospholipase family protein [Anaerolineae bacterium]|nr:patatin-like phospholipase family protein [Anaerolineae bacterium]
MSRTVRILAIDGGGIRGIIPAMVMAEIEQRTNKRIHELFDLIAGTSTGGILALGITKPSEDGGAHYTAEDGVKLYEQEGGRIFDRSIWQRVRSAENLAEPKYPERGVEAVLNEYFGETRLKEALTEVLITSYEIERNIPWFFRSSRAKTNPSYDFPMRFVARATSAAPTYFPPCKIPVDGAAGYYALVDGAVFANNPSMCAYVEAQSRFPDATDYLVVSLGTGEFNNPLYYEKAAHWGLIGWALPVINILMHGVNQTVDYQMRQLMPAVEGGGRRYYRFQTVLPESYTDMDDISPEAMRGYKLLAEELIHKHSAELERVCGQLVQLVSQS